MSSSNLYETGSRCARPEATFRCELFLLLELLPKDADLVLGIGPTNTDRTETYNR